MRFRQIENSEVPSILSDPNLYVLFVETERKIDRRKVCNLLPATVVQYVEDKRYMFGYFEKEEADGR